MTNITLAASDSRQAFVPVCPFPANDLTFGHKPSATAVNPSTMTSGAMTGHAGFADIWYARQPGEHPQ